MDVITLAVHRIPFLTGKEKLRLFQALGAELFDHTVELSDIEMLLKRRITTRRWNPRRFLDEAECDFAFCQRAGFSILRLGEPSYPPLLAEIWDPPFVVFMRGSLWPDHMPLVGVVGTRRPSERGRKAALAMGRECAQRGIGLISGLAFGIDVAAQSACVQHGGYTAAVLGTGIDSIYPHSHVGLAGRILAGGGCILSEYPPGTEARRYQFPERNRLISGIPDSLIVVEAPQRSGALISARYALEEGRDVLVHGDGCHGPSGQGTRALMEDGARVIYSIDELLAHEEGRSDNPE